MKLCNSTLQVCNWYLIEIVLQISFQREALIDWWHFTWKLLLLIENEVQTYIYCTIYNGTVLIM